MSNILNKQQELQKTAFGELSTAQPTPVVQISAQYGLTDEVMDITSETGSAYNDNGLFNVSTGVHPLAIASLNTTRQLSYKPGQGALARFTALFTQGVSSSLQGAGLINSEDAFAFGYYDLAGESENSFGIIYSRDGKTEHQELQISAPSSAVENATVTINGTPYIVPLTNAGGDANITATEIANSLNAQVDNFLFSANTTFGATIVSSMNLIPQTDGVYDFTSGTASGSWTQKEQGQQPSITLIKQEDWNEKTLLDDVNGNWILDPTKGNVYSISIQYLGFGNIRFFVENPDTGDPDLVHQIKYTNKNTAPSVSNPTFRIGWIARNLGNTSELIVSGASAAGFIEGKNVIDSIPRSAEKFSGTIGTTQTNLITIRNRFHFGDKVNRADIVPLLLSMGTLGSKGAFFELTANAEFSSPLTFEYQDEQTSVAEVAKDEVTLIPGTGRFLAAFIVTSQGLVISSNDFKSRILPDDSLTLSAAVTASPASEMIAAAIWQEET